MTGGHGNLVTIPFVIVVALWAVGLIPSWVGLASVIILTLSNTRHPPDDD